MVASIAVMLAVLAFAIYDTLAGKRIVVSDDLTMIQLANAKMLADGLLSVGICTQPERHMLTAVIGRIDNGIERKRQGLIHHG
jgi:hypothetical protein